MKRSVTKLAALFIIVTFIAGCATQNRSSYINDNWYTLSRTIETQKVGPKVENAKKRLEELAFEAKQPMAIYKFIELVPESPRHSDGLALYSQFLRKIISQFTGGQKEKVSREYFVPGQPIFGIGAEVTIGGFFTKEQMRHFALYSWPLSPLIVKQQMEGLSMSGGEGFILNYENGIAYIRGSSFIE